MTTHDHPPSPEQPATPNLLGLFERVGMLVQAQTDEDRGLYQSDPPIHYKEFTPDIEDGEDRDPDVTSITWPLKPEYDKADRFLPSGELMVGTDEKEIVYTFGRVIAEDLDQPNTPKIKKRQKLYNVANPEWESERELSDDEVEELQEIQKVLAEIEQKLAVD
ncbi:hypothetical protein HYW35_03645 [Candidatus Saccharibacteria bacterium]|nr:hypothetical protein [Candidatus Saccharibacteria bacterium]